MMRLTNHHSYSQSTKEAQSPKDRMYLVSVKEHVRRDLGDGPKRQPEGAPGGRGLWLRSHSSVSKLIFFFFALVRCVFTKKY